MDLTVTGAVARPRRTATRLLRTPSGIAGVVLLTGTLVIAFAGPWLTSQSPTALGPPRALPSAEHLLGTDQLGRDVLARVLHGGLDVVAVPTLATLVAFALGAAIGMWSGYAGGRTDLTVSRVADVLISLPPLLLAIVFVAGLGSSIMVLIVVSALFFVPRIVRVVRGATASVATAGYVVAARTRGDSTFEIVAHEVMPNVSGVLVVEFAARLSNVVLFVATLNFLGLGAQPPSSSWGLLVAETQLLLRTNPLAPIVPALLIAALAVSVNLIADQLAAHLARDHVRLGE